MSYCFRAPKKYYRLSESLPCLVGTISKGPAQYTLAYIYEEKISVATNDETISIPAAKKKRLGKKEKGTAWENFYGWKSALTLAAAVKKMKPKLAKSAEAVKEQEKLIGSLGEGVGQHVREKEDARLKDLLSHQRLYEESLARFEQLKL